MPPKGKKVKKDNAIVNVEVLSKYKQKKAIRDYFKKARFSQKYNPPKPIQKTDEYEIMPAVRYILGERLNTHRVTMPAYNSYWIKQIEKEGVTQKVREELNNILAAADFKGNSVSAIADEIHGRISQSVIFDDSINGRDADMYDVSAKFFKESYDAIGKANLNPKNRVIAAQNIADLMIKNYSPIAFVKGNDLDQYTDKYVVKNKDLLKGKLEELDVQNVDELINEVDVALSNGFEYDQYEINETVINSGDKSVNTHTLNMPSFNSFWSKHIGEDSVTQPVRTELNNILKAAGVNENDASALADDIHGPLSQTVAYDSSIDRQKINMQDMAARFFKDSYAAIDKANLGPKNRIIAAQKIADLMIKNYSPMAFVKGDELGQYADKYVAQNKDLLKDQLEKLNVQNADTLIGGVEESLANGFEYDQSEPMIVPEPAVVPEPDPNVNNDPKIEDVDNLDLPKPNIPFFYEKLAKRMGSKEITHQATVDIRNILQDAGITDWTRATELSDATYSFVKNRINSIYNEKTVQETKMSKDVLKFFRGAYESLNGLDLSEPNRILAAQRIADVMLKNYSPVAFIKNDLDHYANDYVLNNRDVFKSELEILKNSNLNYQNIEELMDNVDAARGIYSTVENEATDFTKWLNGRVESPAVYNSAYTELNDIIENAGLTNQNTIAELIRFSLHYGSRTILDHPELDGDNPNMHDIAVQFFEDAYNMIEAGMPAENQIIDDQKVADKVVGMTPKDRIITAQKIADVMLKNYSPAAKDRKNFGSYADNYILKNGDLLREQLEKLNVQNIDTLINDRDIAAARGPGNRTPDMIRGAVLREETDNFMLDKVVNGKVNDNICDILVEAGITKEVAQNLDVGDILNDAYSNKNVPGASISMRDVAKNVFVSTYDAMTKKELTPDKKITTAQKIADVILKNYSPIINKNALSKYAENYVINDKDLFKECATILNIPEDMIKAEMPEEPKAPENENKEPEPKPAEAVEVKNVNDGANISVFIKHLGNFNGMYKSKIEANRFSADIIDAWSKLNNEDVKQKEEGKKLLQERFKDTLKRAFDVEKEAAYNEHRLPEYTEIIKSANEVVRSAMYAYTDLYHNPQSADLFNATAFGGLEAKDMAELTAGKSSWDMDQKSDEAWEIQSREAKAITDKWLKEPNPHEKMIKEMNALANDAKKNGTAANKETYLKLAAAEWLLTNDPRMMIYDYNDPINPIPNWGNRYWKTITETREALGIDKHTSMRDMIQADYSALAKAVKSTTYNETQIKENVLATEERSKIDSIDKQKEQFATQSAHAELTADQQKKAENDIVMTADRVRIVIHSENQRDIMKHEPREFNFTIDPNVRSVRIDLDVSDKTPKVNFNTTK